MENQNRFQYILIFILFVWLMSLTSYVVVINISINVNNNKINNINKTINNRNDNNKINKKNNIKKFILTCNITSSFDKQQYYHCDSKYISFKGYYQML